MKARPLSTPLVFLLITIPRGPQVNPPHFFPSSSTLTVSLSASPIRSALGLLFPRQGMLTAYDLQSPAPAPMTPLIQPFRTHDHRTSLSLAYLNTTTRLRDGGFSCGALDARSVYIESHKVALPVDLTTDRNPEINDNESHLCACCVRRACCGSKADHHRAHPPQ